MEGAHRTWPVLTTCNWIYVPVFLTWRTNSAVDPEYDHFVVIDGHQFPPFSNWRGGLINVELVEGVSGIDIEAGPFTTRIPLLYHDLMTQLQVDESFYEAKVQINGVRLTPDMPGYFFHHGFYMEVVFSPHGSSSSGSRILQDLLRAPSRANAEQGESEREFEDDETTSSRSGQARVHTDAETIHDDDADDTGSTTRERGDPVNTSEAIHVVSLSHVSRHMSSQDSSNQISPVFESEAQPVVISLEQALGPCTNTVVDVQSINAKGPSSPHPQGNVSSNITRHRIALDRLVPAQLPSTDLELPDPSASASLLRQWKEGLCQKLPEDLPFKDETTAWLHRHQELDGDGLLRDVLHLYTDGSARREDDVAACLDTPTVQKEHRFYMMHRLVPSAAKWCSTCQAHGSCIFR